MGLEKGKGGRRRARRHLAGAGVEVAHREWSDKGPMECEKDSTEQLPILSPKTCLSNFTFANIKISLFLEMTSIWL